ncbi:hypothetical protein A3Q56_03907 [Intoshia linei]|uniref:SAM domain-containing protein n=1 Tax=Intoshia linei TaxID=1819745 RepID=A0A177B4I9_9BILA|nr:hypothetical protein A3Q56_03907 [Intoshia linei]
MDFIESGLLSNHCFMMFIDNVSFSYTNDNNSDGKMECLEWDQESKKLKNFGKFSGKMKICANDDTFDQTCQKMKTVEEEFSKVRTKELCYKNTAKLKKSCQIGRIQKQTTCVQQSRITKLNNKNNNITSQLPKITKDSQNGYENKSKKNKINRLMSKLNNILKPLNEFAQIIDITTDKHDENDYNNFKLKNWLVKFNCLHLLKNFLRHYYDFDTIRYMTAQDVIAIGITHFNDRRKILKAIKLLYYEEDTIQFDEHDTLTSWLEKIGLLVYYNNFISNDYREISSLTCLTQEDLDIIGITKLGHVKKLMNYAMKWKQQLGSLKKYKSCNTNINYQYNSLKSCRKLSFMQSNTDLLSRCNLFNELRIRREKSNQNLDEKPLKFESNLSQTHDSPIYSSVWRDDEGIVKDMLSPFSFSTCSKLDNKLCNEKIPLNFINNDKKIAKVTALPQVQDEPINYKISKNFL